MNRPTKEELYMLMAETVSSRSTCLSRKVGAVLVKDDAIISTGFNGPARGMEHCEDIGGCIRRAQSDYKSGAYLELCPAAHAEQNAVALAAKNGHNTSGAVIYVNTFPCKDCMNSIINAGVSKIVYNAEYNASLSSKIASKVGIEVVKYDGRSPKELLYQMYGFEENKNKTR